MSDNNDVYMETKREDDEEHSVPEPNSVDVFEEADDKFKTLADQPHDDLGLVLKCHLMVEHGLKDYLSSVKGLKNIDRAKLTFKQCVVLLDDADKQLLRYKPLAIQLNQMRNRFGHELQTKIEDFDFSAFEKAVKPYVAGYEKALGNVMNLVDQIDEPDAETIKALIAEHAGNDKKKSDSDVNVTRLKRGDRAELLLWFANSFLFAVELAKFHKNQADTAT